MTETASEAATALPRRASRLGPVGLLIYNAFYWPYLMVTCAILFVPALALFLLTAWWDPKRRWLRRYTTYWGAHYLTWAPFAGVKVSGREHLKGVTGCVYVVNHQSMCDILAVYGTYLDLAWVSKIENFYAPFLGWNMWLNGYVALRRGHLPSIRRMLRRSEHMLRGGQALCVFPEGTRSPDGQLIPFYRGAFWLAARAGVPIVPLVVDGTQEVIAKHRARIVPLPVDVHILPPIHAEEVGGDSYALRDLVRARMAEELVRMRGR
ncbi:MAG TPA: lysophospholipid acyltransferase family protein [Polyangiaceae bacterium]|nr:lysophospholipid acyltransferase family protein [Polyangiaceae bacterium]